MPTPGLTSLRASLDTSTILKTAKVFFWVAATKIFIDDNVVTFTPITGNSMSPTLSPSYNETKQTDTVLWKVWGANRDLRRGDVAHFMSPNDPEKFAVKRVIGLPGDTVLLDPRRRPEVKEGPEPLEAKAWDSWRGRAVVPPGHVWVEGDNWRKSSDSNWYGPVSMSLITGKAVVVLWPWGKFWTRPWEEWKGRTRVIKGRDGGGWKGEGLPVELAEVGDLGLPPK